MIVIRIDGLNRTRLLSSFTGGGMRLRRIKVISPSETEVAIAKKDLPKAVAILEAMCYNYSVKSLPTTRKLLLKLPLVLAVVMCAVTLFGSNFFVWRIEVEGASGARLAEVMSIAADNGVRAGVPKQAVNTDVLTAALRGAEGISSASVSMKGNSLKISVLTSQLPQPPDPSSTALISGYDGVVTRIIAESGTAVVKAGDVVKRGDVLITGDIFSTLDGTLIGQTEVKGSAFARVTFNCSYPIRSTSTLLHTGSTFETTAVSLFGIAVGGDLPPFELYDSESRETVLYPLPVKVTRTVYREISSAEAVGEAEKFMNEKSKELFALYGCEFEARSATVNMGGVVVIKAYFTAEICIGEI